MLKTFNLSVQGAKHVEKNIECQDSSLTYTDDNCTIAIVCDGHGDDDSLRSAKGSLLACNIVKDNLLAFYNSVTVEMLDNNSERIFKGLFDSIITMWNSAVNNDYLENPFSESELNKLSDSAKVEYLEQNDISKAYGTTLIATIMTNDYCIGIQIGDGRCVFVDEDGNFSQPIPWDNKCFLNETTSLCDEYALDNFRYFYSKDLPVAVFAGSDGVDDCFNNEEQLYSLYKTVLYSFSTTEFDVAVKELEDYLPRLSKKGSRDDISIASIIQIDKIDKLEFLKSFNDKGSDK